jgi:pimeloyl-ACP methyl ester carboxylesterase
VADASANGRTIEANGLSFHLLDEGDGTPVLLLHGFPDTSYVWRHQMPALVEAGFRAVAPDLRGRGETDAPEAVDDYGLGPLLGDTNGILDALEIDRAHVVGHDWGAVVAWVFASFFPQRVDRLVAVSVGHPGGYADPSVEDLARSWYMWLFQFPGVAEELVTRNDWGFMREWFGKGSADLERWIEDLSRPGRLTAGLNWYRANNRPERLIEPPPEFPPIEAPTLGVYGRKEVAVTEKRMTDSANYVKAPWRYELFDDSGHWIQLDEPERFNELLVEFLTADLER